MMPLYEIRKSELAAYGERQRRGEILIVGMAVTERGYKLQIVETPRVADPMKLPPLAPKPEPKTPQIKCSEQETTNLCGATNSKSQVVRVNPDTPHQFGNIQPLCGRCNSRKKDRL